MKAKARIVIILGLVLSAVFVVRALAVSNYVGGVRCSAIKTNVVNWASSWTHYIYSTADSPIGTIGWTYWKAREHCEGEIIEDFNYGARASYGDDREVASKSKGLFTSCEWGHILQNYGNHDFKHPIVNPTVWQPYGMMESSQ